MNTLQRIAQNTIARSVAEILNRAGSAIFWVLVTRAHGAKGLGILALSTSLTGVFSMLATLGLGSLVIREVSKDERMSGQLLVAGLVLGTAGALLATVAMMGFVSIMGYEREASRACYLMSLSLVPMSLFYWLRAVLCGLQEMHFPTFGRAIENLVKVGVGVVLISHGATIMTLVGLVVFSRFAGALALAWATFTRERLTDVRFNWSLIKRLVSETPVFFGSTLFNSMFWSVPIMLLPKLSTVEAAGLYSAAYKVVDLLLLLSSAFALAIFPVMARMSRLSERLFRDVCLKSLKLVLFFSLALAAGGTVLADRIVVLLYGRDMVIAAPGLQVLIWSLLSAGVTQIAAYALIVRNQQKLDMIGNGVAFATILALSLLLIPRAGVAGGVLAALLATVVFAIVELYFVDRTLFWLPLGASAIKPFLAALAMVMVVFFCHNVSLTLQVIAGGLVYVVLLVLTGAITQGDRELLRQLRTI
ncbi:MAG: flippase [candidate division KSB1 bacterium]|nr:flippase [candidate division KSB1 bacterium]MDZ7294410.1 flippase [candidate division KSB1 bacterium]MDZ7377761.1 flippase [candidate division KSB1 bacterium]MDZ7392876.1 flippase [candidate division KSB1 bacterium]MDZ7411939.1 flippase [candidate division KSB1 bacterium]